MKRPLVELMAEYMNALIDTQKEVTLYLTDQEAYFCKVVDAGTDFIVIETMSYAPEKESGIYRDYKQTYLIPVKSIEQIHLDSELVERTE